MFIIDFKAFFDQSIEKIQEAYEKFVEISRNNNYTTGNLLDYFYNQKCYKRICIDSSRQTNMNIPHKINFTRKFEEDDVQQCFLLPKNSKKILKAFL